MIAFDKVETGDGKISADRWGRVTFNGSYLLVPASSSPATNGMKKGALE